MEIQISNKNEFKFSPNIGDNRKLPEDKQFKLIYKKLNNRLHSSGWTSFDKDGKFKYDLFEKAGVHLIEIENPITLNFAGNKVPVTIDHLTNGKHYELYDIIDQFIDEIEKKDDDGIDKKK